MYDDDYKAQFGLSVKAREGVSLSFNSIWIDDFIKCAHSQH